MWEPSVPFLIALAMLICTFIGLCWVDYQASATRTRLRHRVDPLAVVRGRPGMVTSPPSSRVSDGAGWLTVTALRGDELEFARRVARWHIQATLATRLLLALRLSVGLALTTLLVLFGFYNLRVSNVANLAGLGALGAAFGWKIPHFVMARLVVRRRRAIERGLPDAIELLVISVEAGRSLEDAISRIIPELRRAQPAMAEELEVTGADLRMLPNSDAALRRMADRIDLPSIRSVIITLSQTLKYGTPLAQALRVVAAELRNDGLRKLEEQANRMPVLLTIPMMLFILPSIFMIIGGPAFLTVLNAFNR